MTPSHTCADLLRLAERYDLTVLADRHSKFFFLIVGDKTTIRVKLSEKKDNEPLTHRYGVYLADMFEHPAKPGVWVEQASAALPLWTKTEDIMDVFTAALHLPKCDEVYDRQDINMAMMKCYSAQNGKCAYCQKPMPYRYLTRDHTRPLSRGGRDVPSNWCLACLKCNGKKGRLLPNEFKEIA